MRTKSGKGRISKQIDAISNGKEVHLFREEYITTRVEKTAKIRTVKTEMTGKGLTIHASLLPIMNFMNKLGFWNTVKNEVLAERAPNAH